MVKLRVSSWAKGKLRLLATKHAASKPLNLRLPKTMVVEDLDPFLSLDLYAEAKVRDSRRRWIPRTDGMRCRGKERILEVNMILGNIPSSQGIVCKDRDFYGHPKAER